MIEGQLESSMVGGRDIFYFVASGYQSRVYWLDIYSKNSKYTYVLEDPLSPQ